MIDLGTGECVTYQRRQGNWRRRVIANFVISHAIVYLLTIWDKGNKERYYP